MDNGTIKQVAQNILDTSYKLYSDVSLMNSSLFRAASALGIELPEIPQISLAATNEKMAATALKQASSAMEKLSEGKKVPLFGISKKSRTQESEEEKQAIPQPVIDIKEKNKNKPETALKRWSCLRPAFLSRILCCFLENPLSGPHPNRVYRSIPFQSLLCLYFPFMPRISYLP